jgi:hypothetical protein
MANSYKKTMQELRDLRDEWAAMPKAALQSNPDNPLYKFAYSGVYEGVHSMSKTPFWKFLLEYFGEKLDIWKKKDGQIIVDEDGNPKLDVFKVIGNLWKIVAYIVTLWQVRNQV